MSKPTTRAQFKNYCLRVLGHPVIQINVDDDQVDDRIDEAIAFYEDYHFDGSAKIFMKHKITAEDAARRWIYCPDAIIGVKSVFPFDQSNASINMFDLRYQLRLHDLYDFTSVSYVSYEMTMQHIRTLNLLFSGAPQFRFNRKQNRLMLDVNWSTDLAVGNWVIIECYRRLDADSRRLTGAFATTANSNTIIGTSSTLDQEVVSGDLIVVQTSGVNSEPLTVNTVDSALMMNTYSTFENTANSLVIFLPDTSDVWNDRFLKKYATALIKRQWSANLKKFSGIQMPGGVMLNGQVLFDEAVAELKELEESVHQLSVLPAEGIFIG